MKALIGVGIAVVLVGVVVVEGYALHHQTFPSFDVAGPHPPGGFGSANRPRVFGGPHIFPERPHTKTEDLAARAGQAAGSRDYALAEKLFAESVAESTDMTHAGLADAEFMNGHYDKSYTDYRHVFHNEPPGEAEQNPLTLVRYADLCLLHNDRQEAAKEYFLATQARQSEGVFAIENIAPTLSTKTPLNELRSYAYYAAAGGSPNQSSNDPATGAYIELAAALNPKSAALRYEYGVFLGNSDDGKAQRWQADQMATGDVKAAIHKQRALDNEVYLERPKRYRIRGQDFDVDDPNRPQYKPSGHSLPPAIGDQIVALKYPGWAEKSGLALSNGRHRGSLQVQGSGYATGSPPPFPGRVSKLPKVADVHGGNGVQFARPGHPPVAPGDGDLFFHGVNSTTFAGARAHDPLFHALQAVGIDQYDRALKLRALATPEAQNSRLGLEILGNADWGNSDYEGAMAAYRRMLESDQRNTWDNVEPLIQTRYADLCMIHGRVDEARKWYYKASQTGEPYLFNCLSHCGEAVALDAPLNTLRAYAYNFAARCGGWNHRDDARRYYEVALTFLPKSALIRFNYAESMTGQPGAIDQYWQAEQLATGSLKEMIHGQRHSLGNIYVKGQLPLVVYKPSGKVPTPHVPDPLKTKNPAWAEEGGNQM